MHFPDPLLPLEASFWERAYEGINRVAKAFEMPVRSLARCINTYLYMAVAPAVPPEEMEAVGKRSDQRMQDAIRKLEASWNGEWLPEIKGHLDWWKAFDLRGASMAELKKHLEQTIDRGARLWELHFHIVFPAYMAVVKFDDLHRDLFGNDGAFSSFRMLQGFDNKTLETGNALWTLSRKARSEPAIRQVIEQLEPDEVMKGLPDTPEGRAFRNELRAYLDEYGQRGDTWGLGSPSWIENPTAVIRNLKDYISQSDRASAFEQAERIAERGTAIAGARERLKGYPKPVVDEFEFLLKVAQVGTVLSEDHGFWIDFNSTYCVRRVLMEFGRRLADTGSIDKPDDVFCLTVEELLEGEPGDFRRLVAKRRAEVEHFAKISPPPVLGTDYGPPPDSPFNRFFGKFFGGPPPVSEVPNELKGHAGSPGKVRGTARVINHLEQAGRLNRGDILVAPTTAPPWTPLFATAGGIVTDTGGILSHCAVVAREYRIPAVVGTGRATTMIRDGQALEVDGDTGCVRILGD
jgi:pyruvate,water dikinase